jgi:uncharacterized RDD family membrane protein YckC
MNRHAAFRPDVCDRTVTIRTPENIEFRYTLAGPGTRGAAYLLDSIILGAVGWLLTQPLSAALIQAEGVGPWIAALFGLLLFVVFQGYFVWFDWKGNGRSPGKKTLGIRVIKDGGYALTFTDSLLRNLLRFVDFLPFLNAVGLASICVTRHGQRLGDLVAGTLVVHQHEIATASLTPYIPLATTPASLPAHQLLALPADVHDLAVEFFRYADTLVPLHRQELAAGIAAMITRTATLTPAPNQSAEGFLAAVIRQAGRVALAPEPGAAGTPRPSPGSAA